MKRDIELGAMGGGGPGEAPIAAHAGEADAHSLRRSMVTNVLGAIPKLLYPLLLVFVVRAYGKSAFGLYTLLEATIYFALYLATLGLDKGLLWWIPRQPPAGERRGLRSALLAVGVATLFGTLVLLLAGRAFIDLEHVPVALRADVGWDLALMACGLGPLAFMQMFVHTALAKRQIGAQVWVREALVSFVLMGTALALARAGHAAHGLGWAFLASNAVGLVGSMVLFRRHFAHSGWPRESWWLPRPLVAFALPLWLTGLVASVMLRADLYVLALLTDSATLGVYAAVLQIGKSVRSAHTSFGHMVVALASQVSATQVSSVTQEGATAGASRAGAIHARATSTGASNTRAPGSAHARLTAGFSQASRLVATLLGPLYVFLAMFAGPLLGLFGPGFAHAAPAAVILCACWSLEGILGLHGQVLMGLGRSRLGLLNMLVTLALEVAGLVVLVPRWGLVGAAWSVGLASLAQNVLQIVEARVLLGAFLYDQSSARAVLMAAGAGTCATLTAMILGQRDAWLGRSVAVVVWGAASVATPSSLSYIRRRFLHYRP